jgi:4-amino-4-deoxy-L-arabinose transferase-like glycosyltransferase
MTVLDERSRARLERVLLVGAVVAAALLVLGEWVRVSGQPLGPDAWNFRDMVKGGLRHPYATDYREPFHCWLVRLLLIGGGTSDEAMRILSIGLYALALGIYYVTTRALFGRGFAAVCLFLMALSRKNAALAVEGLRNFEVASALALVVLAGRRAAARPERLGPTVLAGLASALASLVYLTLLGVTQIWLYSNSWWERSLNRRIVLATLVPLAFVLPYLAANRASSGDWFNTLNRHARFYRNLEYQGLPGQPTVAEVASDAYAGPPVTTFGYMTHGRTPAEVATIVGKGFFRWATYRAPSYEAYRTEHFRHFGIPIWGATIVGGCFIVLRNRRFSWVLILVAACGLPFLFLLGIHQLDGRLLNDYLFAWLWLLAGFLPPDPSPP